MMSPGPRLLAGLLLIVPLAGCDTPPPPAAVHAEIGSPLPGLTQDELARFEEGRALFRRAFTADERLGPRFNENACNACHTDPVDGGTGETSVTRAVRQDPDGTCYPLLEGGGPNLRINVLPALRALGEGPVSPPAEATHSARFTIPFIFGLGLVEAIPLETLEALATSGETRPGPSGRIGRNEAGHPARFGRKADVATLADFSDLAIRHEMGLTTPLYPDERDAGSFPPVPPGSDPAPDPEVDARTLERLTDYVRFLAPPSPAEPRDEADRRLVEQGRALFSSMGCVSCHVPVLETGPHPVQALAHRRIALYSDLLLHDMGPDLENVCGAGATTTEIRTEPLMGLRYRRVFLHDGRTGRVMDAILLHGGEAAPAREAFAALDRLTQEAVLRFLGTL